MNTAGSFTAWRQANFELSSDLQTLAALATRQMLPVLNSECLALRNRVLERRFTVAVVGEFKRGKSTLINALLGAEILPADVLPTTATVNRVTFGLAPSATLRFLDGRPPQNFPVDQLAQAVTKLTEASTSLSASLEEAVVTWPVKLCSNGVDIVDTPGLSDEASMTEVTRRLLPQADAAIFVISATAPFSMTEGDLLDELLKMGIHRIFFVLTGIDRLRRVTDRDRIVKAVQVRVSERVEACAARLPDEAGRAFRTRHRTVRVFPVSALQALEGQQTADGELIASSGMPELLTGLEAFLTAMDTIGMQRRLQSVAELTLRFEAALPPPGARHSTAIELERLESMVRALQGPLDAARLDAATWVGEALAEVSQKIPHLQDSGGLRAEVAQTLSLVRNNAAQRWNVDRDGFNLELAEQLRRQATETLGLFEEVMSEILFAHAAPRIQEFGRVVRATRAVLEFTERRLAKLDNHEYCFTGNLPAAPLQLDLSEGELSGSLVPPLSDWLVPLQGAEIQRALEVHRKKSDFDRFFSLDFGGLPTAWQRAAQGTLNPVLNRLLDQSTIQEALRRWIQGGVKRGLAPLDATATALQAASHALHEARSRGQVATEQRYRAWQSERGQISAVQDRVKRISQQLGPLLELVS